MRTEKHRKGNRMKGTNDRERKKDCIYCIIHDPVLLQLQIQEEEIIEKYFMKGNKTFHNTPNQLVAALGQVLTGACSEALQHHTTCSHKEVLVS